jgi:hypothetical protein
MKYNSPVYKIFGIFIVALILLFMAIGLVGCSFMREMEKKDDETKSLTKSDSSYLKKDNKSSLTVDEWTKITERFGTQPPPVIQGGDTNITNTIYQPILERIIERGSRQAATQSSSTDSGTLNRLNAIEKLLTTKTVDTETQVLNIWHMIGIAAIVAVVMILLSKLKIGLR